jgi:hemolysin D
VNAAPPELRDSKPPPLPAPVRRRLAVRADHEFLAPALEVLETPPSPVRMALILIICGFVVAALGWAWFGRIDIIAVAQGKIQPTGRVKVIEPLETGRVRAIDAVNGRHVHSGDILVEFDPTEALADENAAADGLASLRAEIARRKAALAAAAARRFEPPPPIAWDETVTPLLREREDAVLSADLAQLSAQLASIEAQRLQKQAERDQLVKTIETQKRLIATLQERVDMRTTLVNERAGAKSAVIDATETLQYQQTQLAIQQGQLASDETGTAVVATDAEKTLQSFVSENAQKLADAERQAEDLDQKLAKARVKADYMTLRAPIDGIVQASMVTSVGQVVTTGQEAMRIVPDGAALEIEVYALNRDIGFIHEGQDAVVKIDSFPFTRYGTIGARVTRVARDAIPEPDASQIEGDPAKTTVGAGFAGAQRTQNLVFPVMLTPDADSIDVDGRAAPLTPGMTVTVEVKTGSRRILEYVFSPLVETTSGAMKER